MSDITFVQELARRLRDNVSQVIVGKDETIDQLLVALFCEGHVLLEDVPGIRVVDDLASEVYPMPTMAEGNDITWVGRLRQDMSHPNGLAFWVVSDNLRKGAATNSIQIAESMIEQGLV